MLYIKKENKNQTPIGIRLYAESLDEAWEYWYNVLTTEKLEQYSRDGEVVGEALNAVTIIENPTLNILKSDIRKLPMKYMIGELIWYLSGNNTLDAIRNYTGAWDRMSDDGVTVNSNYGYIIQHCIDYSEETLPGREFNQYEYVKDLLKKDPNSRQAVIHIKTPRDTRVNPTKDLNCTVCLQFFIRDGALHCTTYMRSNDLWMGFPNDIFQFTVIQIRMAMELGVDIGYYTHIAGSLHLYKRDYEKSLENIKALKG